MLCVEPMSQKKARFVKPCAKCGTPFQTYERDGARPARRYCSKACWSTRSMTKACETCTAPINEATRFCSKSCAVAGMRGDKAPAWKGGRNSTERQKMAALLRDWRIFVFNRDGYRCQRCGATKDLQAHHIKPFASHPAHRLLLENGLTVCVDCHGAIHGKDFRKRRERLCGSCGAETSGRSARRLCRSCGVADWHARRKSCEKVSSHPKAPPGR